MISYVEWCRDLQAIPIQEQSAWIKASLRSKKHLHIFGRYFFPHIIWGNRPVPECHHDLIGELTDREDSAIIFPRGFSKTTWEKIDTLHDIVYALEPVILYVSHTLTDAQFHFESIKGELESNELLISVYGDLVPPPSQLSYKWTNKHFETTNGVNLVARGAGKGRGVNIKNRRPTKIILDDIETDDEVKNPKLRLKLQDWVNRVIIPSKDKERGFIKMIGTVLSKNCLLLKFYKGHGGIFRKAIERGKSIWPNYWKIQDLHDIRDGYTDADGNYVEGIGSRAFSQEYLNTPINADTAIIQEKWVEENLYDQLPTTPGLRTVIIFDPQSGESDSADFYGLAVVGSFPKDPHRYLMEIKRGRASQLAQAGLVVKTYQRHKATCMFVGVEKILAQVAVYQLVLDWKAGKISLKEFGVDDNDRNIPINFVDPGGKDKVARLEMHEAAFEIGHVHVHRTMSVFIEQLTSFPDVEHDDDIDAFVYALDESYRGGVALKDSQTDNKAGTITGNIEAKKF